MPDPTLRPRARFLDHQGKRLYLIDASNLTADQLVELSDLVAADVRAQPLASVMTITHVKDANIDRRIMEKLRWLADGNKPHVKAACITGLGPVQKLVFSTVRVLSRRDFHILDTVEQAKEFLAKLE